MHEHEDRSRQPTTAFVRRRSSIMQTMLQPTANSLTKKIFGNTRNIYAEGVRQEKLGFSVIHPCCRFRFYWDAMMLSMLLIDINLLPLKIAFFHESHNGFLIALEYSFKVIRLVDIAMNFRTGIIKEEYADGIFLNPRYIALDYLKTWFVLDVLSTVPLDGLFIWFFPASSKSLRSLISLIPVLDIFRLARYGVRFQEEIGISGTSMSICNQVIVMLLVCHWNACLQFLIVLLQDFPSESWVALNELEHSPWWIQYIFALFQALSHMFCVGYGRFVPETVADIWMTIASIVTGAACFIFFIGQVASILSGLNRSSHAYNEKLQEVCEYLNYRRVPKKLRDRVKNYYDHKYRGKMFEEEAILTEANDSIRSQISSFRCHKMIKEVPLFKDTDENFRLQLASLLHLEIYLPGDYIIRRGTIGNRMFFIQEGTVTVLGEKGRNLAHLGSGDYFGGYIASRNELLIRVGLYSRANHGSAQFTHDQQGCLLRNVQRVADVRADDYCYVWMLLRDDFRAIVQHYPTVGHAMEQQDKQRLLDDNAISIASSLDGDNRSDDN